MCASVLPLLQHIGVPSIGCRCCRRVQQGHAEETLFVIGQYASGTYDYWAITDMIEVLLAVNEGGSLGMSVEWTGSGGCPSGWSVRILHHATHGAHHSFLE